MSIWQKIPSDIPTTWSRRSTRSSTTVCSRASRSSIGSPREYVLTLIDSDHDIKTFNFDEIKSELDISDRDHAKALGADGGTFFLDAVINVRKHGLRGNYEAAERFIDTHYDETDQGCIILEELLGTYRDGSS